MSPVTAEDHLLPALQTAGLTLDHDVFVAFSPERIDPGNVLGTHDIPKVVGGVWEASGAVAQAAYDRLVTSVHRVSSARAAELTKLLENTYRAVNIAMANELAQIAHVFDIDVWEVIEAAAASTAARAFPSQILRCYSATPKQAVWSAAFSE